MPQLQYLNSSYQSSGLSFGASFDKLIQALIFKFRFLYNKNLITETFPRKGFVYIFQRPVDKWLKSTTLCNFDSSIVSAQSRVLTKKNKDDTITAMFHFVNSITYNESVKDLSWTSRQASDLLERGFGVCSDRAVLFTALLRSANIPSRVIEGYWSGSAHGWVEVYYWGAWRILDPSNRKLVPVASSEDFIIPSGPFKGETGIKYIYTLDFFSDSYLEEVALYEKIKISNTNSSDPFLIKWYDNIWFGGGS